MSDRLWTEKYSRYQVGNDAQVEHLENWLRDFMDRKPGTKRAALLTGPPGTGKTTTAYRVLEAAGCCVVEHNSSNVRTKLRFEAGLMETVNSGSIMGICNAILIKDVDFLNPSLGGLEVLMRLINPVRGLNRSIKAQDRAAAQLVWKIPIICTINGVPRGRLIDMESDSESIRFDRLTAVDLSKLGLHIMAMEGVIPDEQVVRHAVEVAGGDARSFLNILQSGLGGATDKEVSLMDSARLILGDSPASVTSIVERTEHDALSMISIYFENYLSSGGPEDLATASDQLSQSDVVESRAFRNHDFFLLKFAGTIGCSSAARQRPRGGSLMIDMQQRLSRRNSPAFRGKVTDDLFFSNLRSKCSYIAIKGRQLATLRSKMLRSEAGAEIVEFVATTLTKLLRNENALAVARFLRNSGLTAEMAEDCLRISSFKVVRARDRSLLKTCAGTKGEELELCIADAPPQTLLDGELVSSKTDPADKQFLVFDALHTCKGSLIDRNLGDRLDAAQRDFFDKGRVAVMSVHGRDIMIPILLKIHVPVSKGLDFVSTGIPQLPYRTDGLIFTPTDRPLTFGTSRNIFKHKQLTRNTVDFAITGADGVYYLGVNDRGSLKNVGKFRLDANSALLQMIIDGRIQRGFPPIYECSFVPETSSWKPVKLRRDKDRPNSMMVYDATLKNISENIEIHELFA
ncbi:mRNA capping enzyme family protein [Klebsormidium nitens]|uniref:mRNA guanylyltransferase n=1 Tax=Klebsormidium nitens TaxID=105231 RepID=A0A1Y1IV85_KLENI|nr:mRNA capping enzyme family protein [Klebsormidium nitens]|eukprot:GAQ92766.1 mRNA capping enzyme family protein [Klebsormidium nitens]